MSSTSTPSSSEGRGAGGGRHMNSNSSNSGGRRGGGRRGGGRGASAGGRGGGGGGGGTGRGRSTVAASPRQPAGSTLDGKSPVVSSSLPLPTTTTTPSTTSSTAAAAAAAATSTSSSAPHQHSSTKSLSTRPSGAAATSGGARPESKPKQQPPQSRSSSHRSSARSATATAVAPTEASVAAVSAVAEKESVEAALERAAEQKALLLLKQQQHQQQQRERERAAERDQRTSAVCEAWYHAHLVLDTAQAHQAARLLFQNSNTTSTTTASMAVLPLTLARRDFAVRKKTLKADLKKCTAFVKRIKSGALYHHIASFNTTNSSKNSSSNSSSAALSAGGMDAAAAAMHATCQGIANDVAALNLSRYVEEVVAALMDSKPKGCDVPMVTALAQAMHTRYEEFLPILLPALWSVVWPTTTTATTTTTTTTNNLDGQAAAAAASEASKQRRVYVRILTDFMLHGLLSHADTTKLLLKCLPEWTGTVNNHYMVTDAVAVVTLCKTAGFEVLGVSSSTTRSAMQVIRAEYDRLPMQEQEQHSKKVLDATTTLAQPNDPDQPPEAKEGTTGVSVSESIQGHESFVSTVSLPILVDRPLLEKALATVEQLEPVLASLRAVSPELTTAVWQHSLGAYQTLSASLVQTHHKLQKLEKRCEQDRLVSGNLSAQREKGLADATRLCESLRKSVEALADCLQQPLPHLAKDAVEGDEGAAGLAGGGVEVWTKETAGAQGTENLGPFDDEETRSFYCDIPDLLTTIPPALLGVSEEEIERRKEANSGKYGLGGGVGGGGGAVEEETPPDITPTSAAQLDAVEEGNTLVDDEDIGDLDSGDVEENKDTPHYRLMLLLEQELPECNRREQIDEIAEKFCINHGSSKNSRKRLLKTLFLVPRSRLDLLPYYSRLVATVDRVWHDVASSLATDLEQQFHGQAKFKKNQNIESRLRTARYISELIKFRAAPPIVVFRCIERCIEDFTGINVEIACCLLESCGRYLYRLKHTHAKVSAAMETMTRLSKAKNLDERLLSLLKAAYYSVKPPANGPRKKAKEYPPLEAYLRNLLLVRLEATEAFVSIATKQLVRLPWNDPLYQCGSLVCKIMLKACRKGRYKTIDTIATIAAKMRSQRAAGEVTIRLTDAVIEELRWALDNPNFRDQQRVITYTRLLGALYCSAQVAGNVIIDHLFNFINLGHEIPDSLRDASKKLALQSVVESSSGTINVESKDYKLPVFNSSGSVSQIIREDEEMEETELVTREEEQNTSPKPVAVSTYSIYDPRVPSATDPPNASYRITLVCAMLEVVAKVLVSRSNLPRLKGFMAAFQRYLFTKSTIPTDVEFALLDTFDLVDSYWKSAGQKGQWRSGGDSGTLVDQSFPQYPTWNDAHAATVAFEESEAISDEQKRTRLESLADESKSLSDIHNPLDERSMNDDDTGSLLDEDDDSISAKSRESVDTEVIVDEENMDAGASRETEGKLSGSDGDDIDDDSDNETETDDEEEDEEEFDEQAYMLQLEEEAFERELRMVTMEAIEKGKNTSRKQVGESMISGSQNYKRKMIDPLKSTYDPSAPSTGLALGGEIGISFQVLKKGSKGKVEAKELVVPVDTNLAMVATRHDDAAARERDEIKQRVLRYEAQSESSGGNVYLEQEKLQKNRNRPLSMEEIDKNFGTSGGNLHPSQLEKKAPNPATTPAKGVSGRSSGRGRGPPVSGRGGRGGRVNAGGRALF